MKANNKKECELLLYKYFTYKKEAYKVKVRNKLFILLLPDFKKWITRILYAWNKFENKEQVISLSWECFEYCLLMHDTSYDSFLGRFFKSTRYYLLMKFAKSNSVRIPLEELKEILKIDNSPESLIFDNLLTLYQFRDSLTKENEKVVWDDAFISLSKSHKQRSAQRKNAGMSTGEYARLKKIFINQIKLILNIR